MPLNVSPQEFLGKRTALFGMTRTGRFNSVKKSIQATVGMTEHAPHELDRPSEDGPDETREPFTDDGLPKEPVGQNLFDFNGEDANPLSGKSRPGSNPNNCGHIKQRSLASVHTEKMRIPFEDEIIEELRKRHISIVDLSEGAPEIKSLCGHSSSGC